MNIFQSPYPELLPLPSERFEATQHTFEARNEKIIPLEPLPLLSSVNPNDYLANLVLCVDILYSVDPTLTKDGKPVEHVDLDLLMSYPCDESKRPAVISDEPPTNNKKSIRAIATRILSYCSSKHGSRRKLDLEFDRRRISTAMSVLRELGVVRAERDGPYQRMKRQEALLADIYGWASTLNRIKSLLADELLVDSTNNLPAYSTNNDNEEIETDHQKVLNDLLWLNEQIAYNTFT